MSGFLYLHNDHCRLDDGILRPTFPISINPLTPSNTNNWRWEARSHSQRWQWNQNQLSRIFQSPDFSLPDFLPLLFPNSNICNLFRSHFKVNSIFLSTKFPSICLPTVSFSGYAIAFNLLRNLSPFWSTARYSSTRQEGRARLFELSELTFP
jgi:hypothetical protein